jgi:hypothetical protein
MRLRHAQGQLRCLSQIPQKKGQHFFPSDELPVGVQAHSAENFEHERSHFCGKFFREKHEKEFPMDQTCLKMKQQLLWLYLRATSHS